MKIINLIKNSGLDIVVSGTLIALLGTSIYLNHFKSEPDLKRASSVSVQLTDGTRGFCSGTLIDDPDLSDGNQKTILTAKHCVDDVGQVIKVPYMGSYYDFVVKKISEESDLAILQTDSMFGAPSVKISTEAHFEEKAWAIGYPMGDSKTITEGFLGAIEVQAGFSSVSKSMTFQRATVLIAPGNSGGGLFQIEDGEYRLVGVATGINSKYFFMTYYSPLEEVKEFLKDFGNKEVENG